MLTLSLIHWTMSKQVTSLQIAFNCILCLSSLTLFFTLSLSLSAHINFLSFVHYFHFSFVDANLFSVCLFLFSRNGFFSFVCTFYRSCSRCCCCCCWFSFFPSLLILFRIREEEHLNEFTLFCSMTDCT